MKRNKNWLWSLLLVALAFSLSFGYPTQTKAATSGRIPIVFWNEMGGPTGVALDKIVAGFNASQKTYQVIPQYEGSYDEAVQKFLQTHGSNASPALFQSFDISTAQIMHSKYTTPVQKFIDADHFDMSQIVPAAKAFYSNNGQQLAMPFNTSQPVLYYNATLLKKYKITPPPMSPSYSDITRVAEQLYQRSGHQVKGMTVQVYGWLFEEALANAGVSLANNNNGHTGIPTKVDTTNPTAVNFFNWIRQNVKNGDFINYGSGANAGTNQIAGFLSNKVGIFIESSATIPQLTQGKNKLGITYFPHPDGTKANGVAIGGASLWISNDKPQNVQQGAFDFIKYAVSPQSQANWQKASGYLAINTKSQTAPILQSYYAKQPEAKVPIQQLMAATPNYRNSGILMEGMQQTREYEETAMETIYNGGNINSALQTAQTAINANLNNVNLANGYIKEGK